MVTHDQLLTLCESYRNHPDQGIKACKKTLLKNPKSLLHQLALAWFTANLGSAEEALKLCADIDLKSPNWSEPDVVVEYQDLIVQCRGVLGECMQPAEITKITALWKDQFDKYGKLNHRQIREDMFCAAFANGSWELLQQLFAWLQRDFPKKPQYHFAWIAATQILADSEYGIGEKMKTYFRLLAYRSVQMAITNTRENKDTPKKIVSAKELRLITHVLQRQNQGQELLALLDDAKLGINSDIGKGDIEFIRLKIDYLAQQGRAEELFKFCFDSLSGLLSSKTTDSRQSLTNLNLIWADDWLVWNNMVKAAAATDRNHEAAILIDKYLQIDPRSRNAGRAKLENLDMSPRHEVLTEILSFIDRQSQKPSCFEDLRSTLRHFGESNVDGSSDGSTASFDKIISKAKNFWKQATEKDNPAAAGPKSVIAAINGLKIYYMLAVSPRSSSSLIGVDEALSFIGDCLQLIRQCTGPHMEAANDACILAVMTLTHLALRATADPKPSYSITAPQFLVQALLLIKYLTASSPHNYHAKLLAIRLNALLGLQSESTRQFIAGLDIKQVQWDSLGHLLFTRISALHPVESISSRNRKHGAQSTSSIQGALNEALAWNTKASESITNMLSRDLEMLPFDKLTEFFGFKLRVDESFSHAMIKLENRYMARFSNKPLSTHISDLPTRLPKARKDNRDMSSFPDYEYDSLASSFIMKTSLGPKPGRWWLAGYTVDDLILILLNTAPGKSPSEAITRAINEAMKFIDEDPSGEGQELTAAELIISEARTSFNFLACHLAIGARDAYASTDLRSDFKSLLDLIKEKIESKVIFEGSGDPSSVPTWQYFHTRFVALEHLKAVDKLCDFALITARQKAHPSAAQIPVSLVNDIKKKGREQGGKIQAEVREFGKVLKAKGAAMYTAAAKDGETGKLVTELIGTISLKKWVGEMLDDVVDGIEGMAGLKLY